MKQIHVVKDVKGEMTMRITSKKYRFKLIMAVLLVCTVLPVAGIRASAETQKGYTILSSNTRVYADSGLRKPIGWIYGSDEVTINWITVQYCSVTYPVTGTSRVKSGYVPTNTILTATAGRVKYATANITTYRRADGRTKYGYIAKGDKVVVLNTKGNYTQVRYPIRGGYKFAFISTAYANRYLTVRKTQKPQSPGTNVTYETYWGVNYRNVGLSAERVACLDKAVKMLTVKWTCPVSFRTWKSSAGVYNSVRATDGTADTYFVRGKTYVGVPYSMADHTLDDAGWGALVKSSGFTADYMTTDYGGRKETTAHGTDCSYLTYLCFKAAGTAINVTYQTTSRMMSSAYYQKKNLSAIKGGDIALQSGHVMLYVGRSGSRYAFIEADACDSKVSYNTYSASQLARYGIYRFKGFRD